MPDDKQVNEGGPHSRQQNFNNGALTLVIFFSGVILLITVAGGLLICKLYNDYHNNNKKDGKTKNANKGGFRFELGDTNDPDWVEVGGTLYYMPRKPRPKKIRTKTGKGHVLIFKQKLGWPYNKAAGHYSGSIVEKTRGHYHSHHSPRHWPFFGGKHDSSNNYNNNNNLGDEVDEPFELGDLETITTRDNNILIPRDQKLLHQEDKCKMYEDDGERLIDLSHFVIDQENRENSESIVLVTSPEIFV